MAAGGSAAAASEEDAGLARIKSRIAKMLVSSGFSLDASSKVEDGYERPVAGTTARVRVFTSIVKGEMRVKDADAIRICAVLDTNGSTRGLVKSTRINRTGDSDAITVRLLTAMRKTYKTATKRANDPGFLALPVKASKKRWVPKAKKAGSKRKTAKRINAAQKASDKRINAALKAAAKEHAHRRTHDFKVGDLILHSSMNLDNGENWKGMCKAINAGSISVFWFHSGETSPWPIGKLRHLKAA